MDKRWKRQRELFEAASRMAVSQRGDFLREACRDDRSMLETIEGLLDDHDGEVAPVEATVQAKAESAPRYPERLGPYRLIRPLGEGGMGVVFEAQQDNPRRSVAVKVMRGGPFVDETRRRMFQREAHSLGKLRHPNIAAIYEAGSTDTGQHFFAMELVRGTALDRYCADRDLATRQRLELFVKVCDAIHDAHLRGVIHRDLKPTNILVDESGEPKVLDFGLAKITDNDEGMTTLATDAGKIQGTLAYMSPEQAQGNPDLIDVRSDVYSLGVVLFQILTLKLPYELSGLSITDAVDAICNHEPVRPGSVVQALRGDLETIALKALEKEPSRRYQGVNALADDIRRHLTDQPILARPPSTTYQLKKMVSRHRGTVAALSAIAMLLIALISTALVQARQVRVERDAATSAAARANAINVFLQDAIGGADPWRQGSRNITLLETLRQARIDSEDAFVGQPLLQAEVLQTLGATLSNLAEYEEAESALQQSLQLRVGASGARSADVAASHNDLAGLYEAWRRTDQSLEHATKSVELWREFGRTDRIELGEALEMLAASLRRMARYDEAREAGEEMLAIARATSTPTERHLDLELAALQVLGSIESDRRQGDAAEAYAQEFLSLARERYPRGHPLVVTALNDLGSAQMLTGNLEGATTHYTESIELGTAVLGADHPAVASSRENLGGAYMGLGRADETAKILEEVLATRRRVLGDDSEPVARTLTNTAFVYMQAGDNENSVRMYDEAIPRLSKHLGEAHPDVGLALACKGEVLRRLLRFDESEATLLRALDILVDAAGDEGRMSQWTLQALVNLYADSGRPDRGEPYAARLTAPQAG